MIPSLTWFIRFSGSLQVTCANCIWISVVNLQVTKICHQNENLSISFSSFFLAFLLLKGSIRLSYFEAVTVKTTSTKAGIIFDAHPHMENMVPYRFL